MKRQVTLDGPNGQLDGEYLLPDKARAMVVLAHGAGANFQHKTMLAIAEAFASEQLASLRFNFPFMQVGLRRVDKPAVAIASIVSAVQMAQNDHAELPLFLGGHSFGGRMATHAMADADLGATELSQVRGLTLCSFPLHGPKKPSTVRAEHLDAVQVPILFLSGTRDALAESELLAGVVSRLGDRAQLHWLATADHSYVIRKRERAPEPTVFEEMAGVASYFVAQHI